jgi:hypothetical protein
MGIDIDSKMLIGCRVKKIGIDIDEAKYDDWYEFAEDNEMVLAFPHYDADYEDCFIGFEVSDTKCEDIKESFLNELKIKVAEFKKITGCDSSFMCVNDVTQKALNHDNVYR